MSTEPTFQEICIEAYERRIRLHQDFESREAIKFSEKAVQTLKDLLGKHSEQFGEHITINRANPNSAELELEGLRFIISHNLHSGGDMVSLIKKCEKCGLEYREDIGDIGDIGAALKKPHSSLDCKPKGQEVIPVSTPAERLAQAIIELVQEAQ